MYFFSPIKSRARKPSAANRRTNLKVERLDDRIVPAVDLLPDLVVWADQGRGYMHDWYLDTSTSPGKTLLRFSSAVPNIGSGPLEIRSESHGTGHHHEPSVFQRVYNDAGGYTDHASGSFVWHEAHGHIHFEAFMQTNLRAVTEGDGVGDLVVSGFKTSFMLEDSTVYNNTLPGHPSTRGYYRTGTLQGISVGWADVYHRNLPDQWIDVTNVPAGTYWLESIVDPENNIRESNEDNNITRIQVTIGGSQPDYAGNTMATARPVGTLTTNQTYTDFVSPSDTNDYYRFTLEAAANFSLRMDGLTADADVQLLNSSGGVIARSIASGRNPESITQSLEAGTYFIRVYPYRSASTPYILNIAADSAGADGAGNNIETARDLGDIQVSQTVGDAVSLADTDDYYRFRATGDLSFNLRLTGLTGDAGVELLNDSGAVIAQSTNSGTTAESINYMLHSGDAYFIRVYLQSGNEAAYTLSVAATTPVVDGAGDTMAAARDIGTLTSSQSFQDQIGSPDLNDYYRFSLANQSQFSLRLDGMTADADVQLLNSSGAIVARSINSGSAAENISQLLAAGTYYVRVYPYNGAVTNYNLTMSATPVTTTDIAGNTMATAYEVGQLSGLFNISDAIGASDTNDYYRFNLGSQSTVNIRLDGLTADADVQLLSSTGAVIARSINSGSQAESISQLLSAGTYFVRIYPYRTAITNYQLSLSVA
jgi:hypothetical protein